MPEVIDSPVVTTPEALVELAVERIRETYPNFTANPADPLYRTIVAFANIACETLVLSFDVPEAIVRFVGEVVYQEKPIEATRAEGSAKFKALDAAGHTLAAGTQLIVTPEGTEPIAFETIEALTIAPAATEGTVGIRAVEAGAGANVTGAATVEPVEPLVWLSTSTLVVLPTGATEEETTEEYIQRITELAQIVAPRPIVPADFATFVRLLTTKEKVGRTLAIDLLQLKTSGGRTKVNAEGEGEVEAENVERCVTVIATDTAGKALTTAAREEAEDKLKAAREASFKSFVAGPTITKVNVTVVGKFYKGFTEASVKAELEQALKELLSPVNWGIPTSGGGTTTWINKKILRRQTVIRAIDSVAGFNYYTSLKIGIPTLKEDEEYTLPGIAPLPEAGTLVLTLTEGTE